MSLFTSPLSYHLLENFQEGETKMPRKTTARNEMAFPIHGQYGIFRIRLGMRSTEDKPYPNEMPNYGLRPGPTHL